MILIEILRICLHMFCVSIWVHRISTVNIYMHGSGTLCSISPAGFSWTSRFIFLGCQGIHQKKQSDKPAVYESKKPKNKCSHICPAKGLWVLVYLVYPSRSTCFIKGCPESCRKIWCFSFEAKGVQKHSPDLYIYIYVSFEAKGSQKFVYRICKWLSPKAIFQWILELRLKVPWGQGIKANGLGEVKKSSPVQVSELSLHS